MALRPHLLDRPPSEGARAVVEALLAEVRGRAARLSDPGDGEALHDFRVSVRRLRSTLRAWRGELGPGVKGKDLRRLRRVARATGEARDAEVLAEWVSRAAEELPPAHRPAAAWVHERLTSRRHGSDLGRAAERLLSAAEALSRRLGRTRPLPSEETFARALSDRIRDQVAAVAGWLAGVETVDDAPLAHRARIEAKRLRYLLEPLRDVSGARSEEAVKALRRLQDLLGELNDARVGREAIRAARHEAEAERKRATGPGWRGTLHPGFRALEARAERRAGETFDRLRAGMSPGHGRAFLTPSLDLADLLEARPPPARRPRRRRSPARQGAPAKPGAPVRRTPSRTGQRHPHPQGVRKDGPARG